MDTTSVRTEATGYSIRRFQPDDAAGIVRLVKAIYQDSYYPTDLYSAERIVELNRLGQITSVVAIDSANELVGHYALERHPMESVAEASDAIVLPEHRHHHLLEEMRVLLRQEAVRVGLTGLVGYAVTNHEFSQKAEDHFGAHPCGIALGLWPSTFHNMPTALPQRMSFSIYFKYLRQPTGTKHVHTRHAEICRRISEQFAAATEAAEDGNPPKTGNIEVDYEQPVQSGTIRVRRIGADTAAVVSTTLQELRTHHGAKAVTLEVPLGLPGVAKFCEQTENDGFFFCGVGPAFSSGDDALILQFVDEELDLSLIQIENAFAQELLTYVAGERDRVRRSL